MSSSGGQTNYFSKYFDGSDVGLYYVVIDALQVQADGTLLLSFRDTEFVPGIGFVPVA